MASVHLFFNKNDFKNNVFSFNKCQGDTMGHNGKKKIDHKLLQRK